MWQVNVVNESGLNHGLDKSAMKDSRSIVVVVCRCRCSSWCGSIVPNLLIRWILYINMQK